MRNCVRTCLLFILFPLTLFAETIATFYGNLEVEEPVLLELIHSPAFQRLHFIHQYGVAYYITHPEEYTRYDHSLGVFAVLRIKHASLEEQIAGLLHDVSHTVFSHVGDWIFPKKAGEDDYQSGIHSAFLEASGLGQILAKYGIAIADILPKKHNMLEQPSPTLCADRIDYNIQGAYFQGFISQQEGVEILRDLEFIQGNWVATQEDLIVKIARFSLFMTENCWGSVTNYLSSRWLADAILEGIASNLFSLEDIHFGTDEMIWNLLLQTDNPFIKNQMAKLRNTDKLYFLGSSSDADLIVKSKFRGLDPWIKKKDQLYRLTKINPEFGKEYTDLKKTMAEGWAIKFL